MGAILVKAFRDPSYTLIFLGFFSCGYQLSFVTAHFPALITEMCGADRPLGHAGLARHHHDLGAGRGGDLDDRAGQYRAAR